MTRRPRYSGWQKLGRRDFVIVALAGLLAATPAVAQDFVTSIIGQLRQQGFQSVIEERTLLGRVRVIASRRDGRREIIINPRTGEILRDLWTPGEGETSKVEIFEDRSGSGSVAGEDGDDGEGGDDPDDDEDGEDLDDDESGDDESGGDDDDESN